MSIRPSVFRSKVGGLKAALLALALAAFPTALLAAQAPFEIVPGPRAMTAEEKSLVANPSLGSEQGIILALDTERDDRGEPGSKVMGRLRAKIFNNEGRKLGDIEIPHPPGSMLLKWWAWTLLPDGKVEELSKQGLHDQLVAGSGRSQIQVLKGALPGVVPGCVIEYGYLISVEGLSWRVRADLQMDWPIRELRYHWLPYARRVASFRIVHGEGLSLNPTRDAHSILLTVKDLPALVEEPLMPPLSEVRASLILYYSPASAMPKEFWTHFAKKDAQRAAIFARDKPLKAALDEMGLPEGGSVATKIKAVHDWLVTHVQVISMRSAEEAEEAPDDEETGLFADDILQSRKATRRQMDYLFMGFARVLGAEAYRVLATDRRDRQFEPAMLTTYQFDESLVALHLPGDPPEHYTLIDTRYGLPYREIPWWITGARGFLADPKGGKTIRLEPSQSVKNVSERDVSVSFDPGEGTATVFWDRNDSGQAGLSDHLDLRGMSPEARRTSLEELCGAGAMLEVSRAEAPGLENLNKPLHLACEGKLSGAELVFTEDRFVLRIGGPWNEPVPELAAAVRLHPIVFPFPRIDRTVVEITTPPGYATSQPPAVDPIESPYGHYALFISAVPNGYHVERVFSLSSEEVPVSGYEILRQFLSAVRQADRTEVEFQKAK